MFPASGQREKEREIRPKKKTGLISVCARQLAWPGETERRGFRSPTKYKQKHRDAPCGRVDFHSPCPCVTTHGCCAHEAGRVECGDLSAPGSRRLGLLSAVMWKRAERTRLGEIGKCEKDPLFCSSVHRQ